MIEIYTANTPNGIKIPIALEEMKIDYELILVDLAKRDQKRPEFLTINPNGRIPVIVDTDVLDSNGEPLSIFESGAILLYLAEKYDKLQGKSAADRVRMLEWLFFQMGGIGPMFGQVSFFKSSDVYPSENAVVRFQEEARRLTGVLESRLENNQWLAGSQYTIADIANYGWLRYAESAGIKLPDYPAVRVWREAMESRLAIRKALRRADSPDMLFKDSVHALAAANHRPGNLGAHGFGNSSNAIAFDDG